jgi:hypothetical protein
MRTHWELKRNIMGTHWEPGKNEKKILPLSNLKRGKKARHLECMLGPGQLALAKNTLSIKPKKM